MGDGPTSGPAGEGLSEGRWRTISLVIWALVLATGAFALALMVLGVDDLSLPGLDLPSVALPELPLPGLEGLESTEEPAKPGAVQPEGMSSAEDAPQARPVETDRSGS